MDKSKTKILLVEDDQTLNHVITEELKSENYSVQSVKDLAQAKQKIRSNMYDLVIADLKLPDGEGIDIVKETQKDSGGAPNVIIIPAFGSIQQAVSCLKEGATDFMTKPLNFEHFHITVEKVLQQRELKEEVQFYKKRFENKGFHSLIGKSKKMLEVFDQIKTIAPTDSPVLIMGESGTGKELTAHAIHKESHYAYGPFIPMNCSAIPQELVESELFGHVSGAFTGAKNEREGIFKRAEGGTVFLDEIGEMDLNLQKKLLRFLEDKRVKKVGSDQDEQVDVRIVAATNRDLDIEIESSRFREDLFFRLEGLSIYLPPLRDRVEDIEILIGHFIEFISNSRGKKVQGMEKEARDILLRYDFPGNVRELYNIIDRSVTFAKEDSIKKEDLPKKVLAKGQDQSQDVLDEGFFLSSNKVYTLEEVNKKYIEFVLNLFEGNKRRAASVLGIGR